MKQLQAILITGYYLLATIGVAVNVHYCHGDIASVTVYMSHGSCGCEEEMGMDACCDDATYQFQLQEEQQVPSSVTIQAPFVADVPVEFVRSEKSIQSQGFIPAYQPDPSPPQVPSWLKNQTFLFYG